MIDTDYFEDERGFFIESWVRREYQAAGLDQDFVQDNHSRSARHVLRGLHYQGAPAPMGKLVRCTLGRVLDVAVDVRAGSPRFGRWTSVELTEENKRQLWVPPGFAHGFLTLSDSADVQYKCTDYYRPDVEGALRWNDRAIGIDWPVAEPLLSQKDAAAPTLDDYQQSPAFTWSEG